MVNDRQSLDFTTFASPLGGSDVEWRISAAPVPYPEAVAAMEARVADIAAGQASELVWLLEHPPLYTSAPAARPAISLIPVSRFSRPGAAGNSPITAPASAWPM